MQYKNYPSVTQFNIEKFMLEIDAQSKLLLAGTKLDVNGLTLYFANEITSADEAAFDTFVYSHDGTAPSPYRIMQYINDEFKGYPIENIDFSRHLKAQYALNKKVTMLPNGRPAKSEYFDENNVKVSEISFEFQDQNYLMVDRKEWLKYFREDGTACDPVLINHKIYDLSNVKDGAEAIQERIEARSEIVSGVKAFLSGVIMQALGQSIEQVIATITPFWDETKTNREKFIEFGTQEWLGQINAIDLGTTPHTYLAIPVAQGVTVKDYLMGALNY